MKPKLRVFSPAFQGTPEFKAEYDPAAVGWTRTRHRLGGDRDGEFHLTGGISELNYIFNNWLGGHVVEFETAVPFRGFIWAMILRLQGISRRFSYDDIYNAVRARYRELIINTGFEETTLANWTQVTAAGDTIADEGTAVAKGSHAAKLTNGGGGETYIYQDVITLAQNDYRLKFSTRTSSTELLLNPGFETTTLADWTQTIGGSDTIADETTIVHGGGHAAKLTYVDNGATSLHQDVTVVADVEYQLTFWTRGDGTVGGRYRIYNNTGAADIEALRQTSITEATYEQRTVKFTTPAGCVSVRIYLYAPTAAGSVYFDDISLTRLVQGRYRIRDLTNGADIVPSTDTGQAGDKYKNVAVEFFTPASCVSVRIYLYAPTVAGSAFYDEVSCQRTIDGQETDTYTDWVTNDESIARYGRREYILDAGKAPAAQAVTLRDDKLASCAWPLVSAPDVQDDESAENQEASLVIECAGYWATSFFRYATVDTNGVGDEISDVITNLINTDCDWLSVTEIHSNTTKTVIDPKGERIAGDLLEELIAEQWRITVGEDRGIVYEQISTSPSLYRYGGVYSEFQGAAAPVDSWKVQAGVVVQEGDWPAIANRFDGWLATGNLFVANEWETTPDGKLKLRG